MENHRYEHFYRYKQFLEVLLTKQFTDLCIFVKHMYNHIHIFNNFATYVGNLGYACKVATKGNQNGKGHLICVYFKDFNDVADRKR